MREILAGNADIDHHLIDPLFLRIDLHNRYPHIGKRTADIGQHGNPVVRDNLHQGLILLILRSAGNRSPFHIDKPVFILSRIIDYILTIAFVNGNSVSFCDKSDDIVSRKRIAAFCEFYLTAFKPVDDNASVFAGSVFFCRLFGSATHR